MNEKRYFYITPKDYETANKNGISKRTLERRVRYDGWDVDRAITEKPGKGGHRTGLWDKWKHVSIVQYSTFSDRVRAGMKPEEAATKPITPPNKRYNPKKAFTDEQLKIAASNGVTPKTLYQRMKSKTRKWTIEEAINTPPLSKKECSILATKKKRERGQLGGALK